MLPSLNPAYQTAACVAFDAMRIALGIKPRNYSAEEVILWLRLMSDKPTRQENKTDERQPPTCRTDRYPQHQAER